MKRHDIDPLVIGLAERQHRVFTYAQVERFGVTRRIVSQRTLAGVWHKRYPDVFTTAGAVLTMSGETLAAAWSLHDGHGSGDTAAHLLRIPDAPRPKQIEVLVVRGRAQPRPFLVRETRVFPKRDRALVDGVPITTVTRTLVEVAPHWDPELLRAAWSAEIAAKRTSVARLEICALPLIGIGHPGTARVRALLDELDEDTEPPPQSELEHVLNDLIVAGGYGPMQRQVPLLTLGYRPGVADGFLAHVDAIVEADGRRWHTRVADFERDHARDNALQAEGHSVLRFTHKQLTEHRDQVVATLDRHFGVRGYVRGPSGLWLRAA